MEYITSCYRQQGDDAASLLLQQYLCGQMPVCFACISAGAGREGWEEENGCGHKDQDKDENEARNRAGGYLTGRLLTWFRGFPWMSMAKRRGKYFSRARRELEEAVRQAERELEDGGLSAKAAGADLAGMLCADENVILFGRGRHRIFLLNTMFGKGHVRELSGERDSNGLWLWEGAMESNVGILLASQGFGNGLSPRLLQQVLNVNEVFTQEQADRRLKELAREGERAGSRNMAAVVLYGREFEPG